MSVIVPNGTPLEIAKIIGIVGNNGKINPKFIQTGVMAVSTAGNRLTFPVAFDRTPKIFTTPIWGDASGYAGHIGADGNKQGVTLFASLGSGATPQNIYVNWLAIDTEYMFGGGAYKCSCSGKGYSCGYLREEVAA
jgi:hypothetical protein